MYRRPEREQREFYVNYGILERYVIIFARSSLEAGAKFLEACPGEMINSIEDILQCRKMLKAA